MRRAPLLLAALALGCGPDRERPECIELSASCDPLYPPEFQQIFDRTLSRTCAQTGSGCHGPSGRRGGLVFQDVDESFALLTGQGGGKTRVVPGDAACSEMVVRIESIGQDWQMPPGTPLLAGERCSIRQWVQAGAQR